MKEIKVGIIGADARHWKPEQIPKVKEQITKCLLQIETPEKLEALQKYLHADFNLPTKSFSLRKFEDFIKAATEFEKVLNDYKNSIILVSGHCPFGGVDIWSEEIADGFNIKKEIHSAETNQWEDKFTYSFSGSTRQKGYRTRNLEIAQSVNVLFDIEPIIGHGNRFTEEIYNDLFKRYSRFGKAKFELELIAQYPESEKNKYRNSEIGDAISGIPIKIETDARGMWLCYDDGYAREIGKTVNEWTAVYTSGGYWTLNQALKLKKYGSRMIPVGGT